MSTQLLQSNKCLGREELCKSDCPTKYMMRTFSFLLLLFACQAANGQSMTKNVLFLGNSYTYVNDLPGMISSCAASAGDGLTYKSNTPGGEALGDHLYDSTSLSYIMLGGWDYVVLQGQSSEFTELHEWLFQENYSLDSLVMLYAPCGKTMYYMTWGYEFGDTSGCHFNPNVCTYDLMDSSIRAIYTIIADTNKAEISPVGAVRHYIRNNNPSIQLYQPDFSHPTVAGTYAAACCFYAAIYRKDPTLITYNPGLAASDAANIRNAAKTVAYDSLPAWNIGPYDTVTNPGCTTGVPYECHETYWYVSPNPALNTLTIHTGTATNIPVRIYNMTGIVVKEEAITATKNIDISQLLPGVYIVSIASQTCTFVKQ